MEQDNSIVEKVYNRRLIIGFFIGLAIVIILIVYYSRKPCCVRGRISQAEAEMRNIATALEDYYIDNNAYPLAFDNFNFKPIPFNDKHISIGYTSGFLTTPAAYLPALPMDPFGEDLNNFPQYLYRYGTNGNSCWILASNGPDMEKFEKPVPELIFLKSLCDLNLALSDGHMRDYTYDPTNGDVSFGDVWQVGP